MKQLILVTLFLSSTVALAQTAAPAAPAPAAASSPHHPCEAIRNSCKAAGFYKKGHKAGKGLKKDCVDPILAGQSVPGVSVPADVVQACQQRKTSHTSK